MTSPIVMAAFGTTSKAQATYQHIHKQLSQLLPERKILWAYSSKRITRTLQDRGTEILSPEELLLQLQSEGHDHTTVQSLHLFPGTEFHSLLRIMQRSGLSCKTGLPLLTSQADYQEIADLLGHTITQRADRTILILGHGTEHPSWTGYYSLEKILRKTYGEDIHVGVVEKYPDSATLVEELANGPKRKVTIIPFFLVCGMHYRRDIMAADNSSWTTRLKNENFEVEVIDQGLGLTPGIEKLLLRHILEAEKDQH